MKKKKDNIIWLCVYIIWVCFGFLLAFIFISIDLSELTEKVGVFFIPYVLIVYSLLYLAFSNKAKRGHVESLTLGIIFIFYSLYELNNDAETYYWDFKVNKGAFAILLIIGIISFLCGIFGIKEDRSLSYFICTNCKKTFDKKLNGDQGCPKCNGDVVNYKTFFEQGHSFIKN